MEQPVSLQLHRPASCAVFRHEAMATQWEFWLCDHPSDYLAQAAQAAWMRIDEIEDRLSLYRESSDVSRVNRAPRGTSLRIGDELQECLLLAREASALTGGAFNVFLGRASLAAKKQSPPHLSTADVPPWSGETCLHFDSGTGIVTRLSEQALIDLGALGKGYALDQAALVLAEWNISTACLIAGGSSVLALDPPAAAEAYALTLSGTEAPLLLQRQAIGASGLAFQHAHIIDPATGHSGVLHSRAYALTGCAALADALSTAAMLLPEQRLREICQQTPGLCFFVQPNQPGRDLVIIPPFAPT